MWDVGQIIMNLFFSEDEKVTIEDSLRLTTLKVLCNDKNYTVSEINEISLSSSSFSETLYDELHASKWLSLVMPFQRKCKRYTSDTGQQSPLFLKTSNKNVLSMNFQNTNYLSVGWFLSQKLLLPQNKHRTTTLKT